MQRSVVLLLCLVLVGPNVFSQTAPTEGLRDNTPTVHAFTNARIILGPGRVLPSGTLVIRNGIIEAAGERVTAPADARIWNTKGLTLYAGLIDLSSDYGLPKPRRDLQQGPFDISSPAPPAEKPKGAVHWNVKMKADRDAAQEFQPDPKTAEKLRSQGFTLVHVVPQDGIFRGQSALVNLGDGPARDLVVKLHVTHGVTFYQEGGFFSGYPHSLMGIIAFIRQTWNDADWYRKAWESHRRNPAQQRPETNNALAALGDAAQGRQRVMMDANDDLAVLRAAKIGKEFSLNMLIRGSGYEYRRLDAIKATGVSLIVPLNFPDAPPVETPEEALNVSLEELRHWDAATENAARLAKAGISFALTTAQLRDAGTFLAQVRKAVQRGLSPDAALAALTTTPAKWMGMENQVGTLEPGKAANIVITDGDLFAENTKVREVWIDGKRYEVNVPPLQDVRGTWSLQLSHMADTPVLLTLKGEAEKPTGSVTWGEKEVSLGSVVYKSGRIAFTLATDSVALPGTATMSGTVGEKEIMGVGTGGDGVSFTWKGIRIGQAQAAPDSVSAKKAEAASFPDVFPPGEFGRLRPPEQPQTILIRNATIWTQGKQGKLENADLLVTRGKISQVGRNLSAPANAMVIDETGKHVTPGLIDCHSHTAVVGFGVNEGGQAITCETRIEDVLDPDDIWIYRQLAGGLTAANILHGSANPIGGQNAVVKWRWGVLPEELLIAGAQPGVKFALGENVKRSNFTPPPGTPARYPATRMGVEQIIRDRFKAARDYERAWKDWERDKASIPPRRDLELDAIVEMLNGRRLIHAHSYRQDEILMLIRLAEEFGIRIATFQHVLEGYKVADAIAKHGAGASSFSDWWAYKMEAWDAIPGNGPLMHEQGVLVSYNSDNNQLATRMNWEAAKALPFGIPETEALNFVTLNAAKQLRIDNRVGSLEQGKDADFVIWSGPPLSTSTKCEQTWVDGRKYFDLREDMLMRTQIERERATLVQKILAAKKAGGSTGGSGMRGPRRPNDQNINSCMEELIHELH